jgi:hypothetical protein
MRIRYNLELKERGNINVETLKNKVEEEIKFIFDNPDEDFYVSCKQDKKNRDTYYVQIFLD